MIKCNDEFNSSCYRVNGGCKNPNCMFAYDDGRLETPHTISAEDLGYSYEELFKQLEIAKKALKHAVSDRNNLAERDSLTEANSVEHYMEQAKKDLNDETTCD